MTSLHAGVLVATFRCDAPARFGGLVDERPIVAGDGGCRSRTRNAHAPLGSQGSAAPCPRANAQNALPRRVIDQRARPWSRRWPRALDDIFSLPVRGGDSRLIRCAHFRFWPTSELDIARQRVRRLSCFRVAAGSGHAGHPVRVAMRDASPRRSHARRLRSGARLRLTGSRIRSGAARLVS
jgi:hypothetical protein